MRNSQRNQRVVVSVLILVMLNSWQLLTGWVGERPLSDPPNVASAPASWPSKTDSATRAKVRESYGKLPLSFEVNEGQFDSRVKFLSRAGNRTLFLTSTEAVLSLEAAERPSRAGHQISAAVPFADGAARLESKVESAASVLRMKLAGANGSASVTGLDELPGKTNYFIGKDPKKWRVNVTNYAKVKYESVYPGIDLVYYGNQRQIEYDLIVAPGADPRRIRVAFDGAQRMTIDESGDLVFKTPIGEIRQHKPVVYQEIEGVRRIVSARYKIRGAGEVGLDIDRYDASAVLVVDPTLVYSTYLGGNSFDIANSIAVDGAGFAYVAGITASTSFPTANPIQQQLSGSIEGFVTKLNTLGSSLVYSTFLGGSFDDSATGVAVDQFGNAYVTGSTLSADFPTVNPVQPSRGIMNDAFVTKLNPTGSGLVYSTFLGGNSTDIGQSIAVDQAGSAYVTGSTVSTDFPTANAIQPAFGGLFSDGFVTKFSPTGGALIYSTYLGGAGADRGLGIAADSAGNAYITGETSSGDFPTANALQPVFTGKSVFKSIDSGGNWSHVNNALPAHLLVIGLAIDPQSPSTIFAATSGGVFKSTNQGGNWSLVFAPTQFSLIGPAVASVAIDPANSSNVYAGGQGVYRTTDGGVTWTSPSGFAFTRTTNALLVDPVLASTVYAGTIFGIYKSTDSGGTWAAAPGLIQLESIRCIAADPVNPAILYAATGFGLRKSVNGGGLWQGLPIPATSANTVVIDPATPSTIYAGSRDAFGAFKSTDAGSSWLPINNGLNGLSVNAMAIDPSNPSTIYAATSLGISRSTDGGGNWVTINNGLTSFPVNAVAVDPKESFRLYAGAPSASDAFITKLNGIGTLDFSTYIGGSNVEIGSAIAIDGLGSAYVAGYTQSGNFPIASAIQPALNGVFGDAFVAKLNPSGNQLTFSTYLGGSRDDAATGIGVTAAGDAWIAGNTASFDLPTVNTLQPPRGAGDAFVAKLNRAGTALLFSTYLGGSRTSMNPGVDQANDIVVDMAGNAYVGGSTQSMDFPTTPGAFQPARSGPSDLIDAFITKISAPDFDLCLADESSGSFLLIDSSAGGYQFTNCLGVTLSGTGTITRRGCLITLQVNGPDRRLLARIDTCMKSGTASIQFLSAPAMFNITDRNITNNSCVCAAN